MITSHYSKLHMMQTILRICVVASLLVLCSGQDPPNRYSIPNVSPTDCKNGPEDAFHEYFDITQMKCVACSQNATIQIASQDRYSCVCFGDYRLRTITDAGRITFECEQCPTGQVASLDGWECVTCQTTSSPPATECPACSAANDLTAERNLNGVWLRTPNDTTAEVRDCVTCSAETLPSDVGGRCVRCDQSLSVQTNPGRSCDCPADQTTGGLCFQSVADLEPDNPTLYRVDFPTLGESMTSSFFLDHLRAAQAMCTDYSTMGSDRVNYSNLTACQLLGNLCTMLVYSSLYDPRGGSSVDQDACSLHLRLTQSFPDTTRFEPHQPGNSDIWREAMPWLYYQADDTVRVLDDKGIPTEYTSSDSLDFKVAKYNATGHYLGLYDVNHGEIQLCPSDERVQSAAFHIGTAFQQTTDRKNKMATMIHQCNIEVDQLLEQTTYFYDMYLPYTQNRQTRLQPIPLLVKNYANRAGTLVNQGSDRSLWQLTRRFYLIDNISGKEAAAPASEAPRAVRVAQSMKIKVTFQPDQHAGKILVPYMEVTYLDVAVEQGSNIQVSFDVEYSMDLRKHDRDLAIAMGVMSALAIVSAGFVTSNYNRREGKIAIECITLLKFILFSAGALSNAFFVVLLGWSLWWLILYKAQDAMYLVPDRQADYYIEAFLGSAFGLKTIQLIHLIYVQCSVDIFLIDWEKSKKNAHEEATSALHQTMREISSSPARFDASSSSTSTPSRLGMRGNAVPKTKKQFPVSIWRTYFVANEWNELQTYRRINPFTQMILVMAILYCARVENLAKFDTISHLQAGSDVYRGDSSVIFRFAIGASIYLGVALAQWIWYLLIWSRFKQHPVLDFVDLCSSVNISVFIMTHEQYGHYIHGRSSHGNADVSLRQMYDNMAREEHDLCGTRGLAPGSDQQTYEVFIPKKLRTEYNKVLFDVWKASQQQRHGRTGVPRQGATSGTQLNEEQIKKIEAYHVLNKFLQSFLDHNLPQVEYVVTQKPFIQRVLDTEFIQNFDMGHFYSDYGHSFDKALFYGHEMTLQLFYVMFFCIMDLASNNFILAIVLTYVLEEIITRIRSAVGSNNIARKTMVDGRFLI